MFGNSDKEYYRRQHQQRMQTSCLKAELFEKAFSNCTQEFVFLSEIVLRKSFITEVKKGKDCTYIYYLSFDLKGHLESLTEYTTIKETDFSFDQICNLLKYKYMNPNILSLFCLIGIAIVFEWYEPGFFSNLLGF